MSTQRGPKSLLAALKAAPTVSDSYAQRPHPQSVPHERQCGWEERPVSEHMTKELWSKERKYLAQQLRLQCLFPRGNQGV